MAKTNLLPPLPPRHRCDHKGTYGTAVLVAGSLGMAGAAALCARAALLSGAGLTRLLTAKTIVSIVAVAVLIVVDAVQERIPIRQTLNRRGIPLRWVLAYGCLLAIIIFGMYGHGYGSAFIYERY